MRRYIQAIVAASVGAASLSALAVPAAIAQDGETAAAAPDAISDADMELAVEGQLAISDEVSAEDVTVQVDGGVVTLTGEVPGYLQKVAAAEIAEKVKGVRSVVNLIEAAPDHRSDAEIRADVLEALAFDPITESWEISVVVNNGVVTLGGEVDSYSEKQIAADEARDVAGVVAVNNAIEYDVVEERPDSAVQAEIETRLRNDASIDSQLIDVDVDAGRVDLSGSVASAAEKSEAVSDVWGVDGVTAVDASELEVRWWLRSEMEDTAAGLSDAEIEEAVERNLLYSPRVAGYRIDVDVAGGTATLTGTVDNLEAKATAGDIALETLGVWQVENSLLVDLPSLRSDTEIADDIRQSLITDPYVDADNVSVDVDNAEVTLTGSVDTYYMRRRADNIASGARGAVSVNNDLAVTYVVPDKTDSQILEDIRDELWWSPFVDSDDITVTVEQGVATLFGSVEDWSEYQSAEENAREGGATDVINKLKIER